MHIQVLWSVTGRTATVAYPTANLKGQPVSINLAPFAPALFATNAQGTGQGSILIAGTASIAAPAGAFPGSQPVARGSYIEIYCTGLGARFACPGYRGACVVIYSGQHRDETNRKN
jgi:uncharacterized protein (TIGR03437 family)